MGLIIFGLVISIFILEMLLQLTSVALYKAQRTTLPWEVIETDAIRILTVGESTTAELYNYNTSWPTLLEEILNAESDKNFIVLNDAVVASNTLLILSDVKNDIQKYNPDIVITMMGVNDGVINQGTPKIESSPNETFLFTLISKSKLFSLSKCLKSSLISMQKADIIKEVNQFNNTNIHPKNVLKITLDEAIETENIEIIESYIQWEEYINNFLNLIEKYPDEPKVYTLLGMFYIGSNQFENAKAAFEKGLLLNPEGNEQLMASLILLNRLLEGDSTWDSAFKLYENLGIPFFLGSKEEVAESTKQNYRQIHEILKEEGILHIAMQYPTLDPATLRESLIGFEDIYFVNNENNFNEALSRKDYYDLFIDKFGNSFGHTTNEGGQMIAENVAEVILNYFETAK